MLVFRTLAGVSRTTAFKQTFDRIRLPTGWRQQLQTSLQPVIKDFFEEKLRTVLIEETGQLALALRHTLLIGAAVCTQHASMLSSLHLDTMLMNVAQFL